MIIRCQSCNKAYRVPEGTTRMEFPCGRCKEMVSYTAGEEAAEVQARAESLSAEARAAQTMRIEHEVL